MAMALKSKNNHYHWYNVQRRHFIEAAKNVNYSVENAEWILNDMLGKVEAVIAQVSMQIPNHFPAQISKAIFEGMRLMKKRLILE